VPNCDTLEMSGRQRYKRFACNGALAHYLHISITVPNNDLTRTC